VLPALVAIALPLVFPNGAGQWRWVGWLGGAGVLFGLVANAFEPGPTDVERELENPFGIAGAGEALSLLDNLATVVLTAAVLGAGAAVIVRLRRARGVERQQLKWFAYAALVVVAALVIATVFESIDVVTGLAGLVALVFVSAGIPAATATAILKHRLYDIDVVIKRTLVYGVLTATLAAIYLASVLLLQLVLSPSSDLAIAGSTLAVAALFRPARNRVQTVVNRRFYRSAYDAQRTVETFGATLRDELSLDALTLGLRTVVTDTMQPTHVSLWLR
jgi:hypothetical protein